MLQQVKRAALAASRLSGFDTLLARSRWRTDRFLILCYHGISLEREHEWNPDLYMSPEAFGLRLALLAKHRCTVLSLDDALRRSEANDLPPRSVVITFDDGMFDFHHRAMPILKQFGFPATVYLTSFYSQFQHPVFYLACSYLLWKHQGAPEILRGIEDWLRRENPSAERQQSAFEELASQHGEDAAEWGRKRILHLMTPEEVRDAARQGFRVQLHTHRHRTPVDAALFAREIDENRDCIQRWTGQDTPHFCYPNGTVHSEFLPWLHKAGVRSGVTCIPGLARASDNRLLLPRLVDHSGLSELEFESWLSGAGAILRALRPQSDRSPLVPAACPPAERGRHAPE